MNFVFGKVFFFCIKHKHTHTLKNQKMKKNKYTFKEKLHIQNEIGLRYSACRSVFDIINDIRSILTILALFNICTFIQQQF